MSDDALIDTGLLGVPVNPPPAAVPIGVPALPAPAPVPAVPADQMPTGWTIQKVAALVREVAHNMYDLPYILKTHSLTQEQYDRLAKTEAFQSALQIMTAEWASIGNTQKRIALEAAIALEDALPTVAARLSKSQEPLAGVVELAKLLAKMAGIGEHAAQNAPTERFKITINLGADVAEFDKSKPVVQIQTLAEGQSGAAPVQQFIQGPPA